jgi:fucose 4-O-acetylase-like acetyltransferase
VGRLEWLDAARGLAILAVVLGHAAPNSEPLYWWHIPCFYAISGYLIDSSQDDLVYVSRRASRLLIPYSAWLVILSLPALAGWIHSQNKQEFSHGIGVLLFGGAKLPSPLGALWFLTSLYFSSVVFHWLIRHFSSVWVFTFVGLAYALALMRQAFLPRVSFPLEVDSILMALPFFYLGYQFRAHRAEQWTAPLAAMGCLFVTVVIAYYCGIPVPKFDVKNWRYGTPLISLALSAVGTATCVYLAMHGGKLKSSLSWLGRASLCIMVLHEPIYVLATSEGVASWPLKFALGIAIPSLVFVCLERSWVTRQFLLGQVEEHC